MKFEYEYYFYDGYNSNSLINYYCEGVYFDLDNNEKLLVPDTFKNLAANSYINKQYVDTLKDFNRFIVKTNIFYDLFNYKTKLYIDSTVFEFEGPNVDTIVKIINPKKIKVEIGLTNKRYNYMPKASFKSIITDDIGIESFNYYNIKIPIKANSFNYKYLEPFRIKDMGGYYIQLNNLKKIMLISQ